MDERQVYTIGHSDHNLVEFVGLLLCHGTTLVVDVRSQPYSRWTPQFNRESLSHYLQESGIAYRFMGNLLGGRPSDPARYDPGQGVRTQSLRPDYARMEQTSNYQAGVDQLLDLAQNQLTTVMCSEGDHRSCHRHLLIAQTLLACDTRVRHIQPDGSIVEAELRPRQLSLFG